MAKYRKYSKEFKLQATRLVTQQAAKRLGITGWSIRNWVIQFRQKFKLPGQSETQPQADELKQLRKENARLKMKNDIFKKSVGVFCKGVAVKYVRMKSHIRQFPVAVMCRVLKMSTSGYYGSLK